MRSEFSIFAKNGSSAYMRDTPRASVWGLLSSAGLWFDELVEECDRTKGRSNFLLSFGSAICARHIAWGAPSLLPDAFKASWRRPWSGAKEMEARRQSLLKATKQSSDRKMQGGIAVGLDESFDEYRAQ